MQRMAMEEALIFLTGFQTEDLMILVSFFVLAVFLTAFLISFQRGRSKAEMIKDKQEEDSDWVKKHTQA